MQMLRQCFHILGQAVAAHEAHAGDLPPVFVQEGVQSTLVQHIPDVLLQVRTMAAHAPVRTMRDVHGEGHLVGNLLEDDVVVVVF